MEQVNVPSEIGVLPLRNSVLFPHAIMPISVGRRKTLNLLDDVVRTNKLIAVISQRNPADDDPNPDDMYRVGTVSRILKDHGAREALNFDGGGSSALWVAGSLVNEPSDRGGERKVGSILALVPERDGDDEE